MENIGHYMYGSNLVRHRHGATRIAAGSPGFDLSLEELQSKYSYDVAYVIAGYEHRPDLISDVFYYTPDYWWLILLYNNIDDPFEGLNVGDQIKIPKLL